MTHVQKDTCDKNCVNSFMDPCFNDVAYHSDPIESFFDGLTKGFTDTVTRKGGRHLLSRTTKYSSSRKPQSIKSVRSSAHIKR